MERLDFDIKPSGLGGNIGMPDFNYTETYTMGVPLNLLRAASASSGFAAKLTGRGGSSIMTVDQERLIGFLRKYDEVKGALKAQQ